MNQLIIIRNKIDRHMKRLYSIISVLALIALTGCYKERAYNDNSRKAISFSVTFSEETKATADSFEEGDVIGLSASEPVNLCREVLNYTQGELTPTHSLYWPVDSQTETSANFVAWYPFNFFGTETDPLAGDVDFEMPSIQIDENFYSTYDLLAATTSATMADDRVNLSFHHCFSRLRIVVVDQLSTDSFRDYQAPGFYSLEVDGIKMGASISLATGSIAAVDATYDYVYPQKAAEKTYWALLVPQTINPEIVVRLNSEKTIRYTASSPITFRPGKQISTILTLKEDGISFQCEVGDWENDPGELAFRVVPPNNEIWYSSSDGSIVTPVSPNDFNASIVSNVYENGKGVIRFSDTLNGIPSNAFKDCSKLRTISMPNSIINIGEFAFYNCYRLNEVGLSNNLARIENYAFRKCSALSAVGFPLTLREICDGSFMECSSLESIVIPSSVAILGAASLSGCQNLSGITVVPAIPPVLEYYAFDSTGDCPIYVPAASLDAYKSAEGWSNYADRIQALAQ